MRLESMKARVSRAKLWAALAAVVATALCSTSCSLLQSDTLGIALLRSGLADTLHIETVRYTVQSHDLPPAFDGVRIAYVCDIHRGPYYSEAHVGRLVDYVDSLETDLILLGGDYVYTSTSYESSCLSQLERLRAPLGCYAALGNHDHGRPDSDSPGTSNVIAAAGEAGIPLLLNEGVWLQRGDARIRLGGVDDYKAGTVDLDPVIEGTSARDFVLLLSHHPDFSEKLPMDAVDLVLSGHTHGGQVTFFGVWAPDVPSEYGDKYRTGLVENDVTTVIVSNGVGTSTFLPIRVYAPAQVVIVTLRSDS